jgi:hypothetical protein
MHEMGIEPHIVETILNHTGHKAGTAGVYNRAEYRALIRRAVIMWADHIAAIVENRGEKVVALRQLAAS